MSDAEIREFLQQIRAGLKKAEATLRAADALTALGMKGIDVTGLKHQAGVLRMLENAYTKILNGEPFTEDD
jgi:hypothetical protein